MLNLCVLPYPCEVDRSPRFLHEETKPQRSNDTRTFSQDRTQVGLSPKSGSLLFLHSSPFGTKGLEPQHLGTGAPSPRHSLLDPPLGEGLPFSRSLVQPNADGQRAALVHEADGTFTKAPAPLQAGAPHTPDYPPIPKLPLIQWCRVIQLVQPA